MAKQVSKAPKGKAQPTKQAASAPAPVAAPVVAPAPVQPLVALRGGLVVGKVALTGKLYRVAAAHNVQWWQACQQCIATGNGTATVQALLAANVPANFVGYVVRRGYLQAVA